MYERKQRLKSRRAFLASSTAVVAGLANSEVVLGQVDPVPNPRPAGPRQLAKTRMEIAEVLPLPDDRLWKLVQQCGVKYVVGSLSNPPNRLSNPEQVQTMEGDSNERPGYSALGRLFAIGYIRGLQHQIYAT